MEVTDYNPSPIAPFHLDTQPVLPTTYEDSLSFYECLAQLTDKLNLLIDEVNTHEVDIEQLKEEFNSLDEQVKKLQKEMLEAQANIEKLLPLIEKMTEVEGKIAALEKRVKTNEDNIGSLQSDMTQAQTDIQTNAGGIAKNKSDIEGLRTDLTNTQGELATAEGEIDALQEDMTQAQADIGDLQGRVTANEGNITDLQGRVTTNEGAIDGLTDRVTTNEGDIADLKGRMTTAEGTLTDTAAKAEKNAGDIAALQESVTAAQGDITALQEDMTQAQGDITALQGDVAQAQTDIQTNADGVAQNKADIAALKAGMGGNTGVDFSSLTGLSNVSTGASLEEGGVTVTSTADAPAMAGVTVTSRGELNAGDSGDFHFNAKLHLPIVASETVDIATVSSGTYAALNYKGQADVDKLKEDVAGLTTQVSDLKTSVDTATTGLAKGTVEDITSLTTKTVASDWPATGVGLSDSGVSVTATGEIDYGDNKKKNISTVVSLPVAETNMIEPVIVEPSSDNGNTGKSFGMNYKGMPIKSMTLEEFSTSGETLVLPEGEVRVVLYPANGDLVLTDISQIAGIFVGDGKTTMAALKPLNLPFNVSGTREVRISGLGYGYDTPIGGHERLLTELDLDAIPKVTCLTGSADAAGDATDMHYTVYTIQSKAESVTNGVKDEAVTNITTQIGFFWFKLDIGSLGEFKTKYTIPYPTYGNGNYHVITSKVKSVTASINNNFNPETETAESIQVGLAAENYNNEVYLYIRPLSSETVQSSNYLVYMAVFAQS